MRCSTGGVVWSPALGPRSHMFRAGILHTVAPYNTDIDRDDKLRRCYSNSLSEAARRSCSGEDESTVTTTLLGTGVKMISVDDSALCLKQSLRRSDEKFTQDLVVELVLQTSEVCDQVINL